MSAGNVSRGPRRVLLVKPAPRGNRREAIQELASSCAASGCWEKPQGGALRDRRWCAAHMAEVLRGGRDLFLTCGCIPVACPDCAAVAASGCTVFVVGERYNISGEVWGPRPEEADFRYLVRLGAFRAGLSRAQLISAGIRWDYALNLLRPDRPGSWEPRRARDVAEAIRAPLLQEADVVVLLGVRVRDAFGFGGAAGPRRLDDRFVLLPPGRSQYWNGGEVAANLVRTTFREALGAPVENR